MLTQARYEADLARHQYDAVDPANRLVAAELELRWNDRLAEVQHQEERLAGVAAAQPERLSAVETDRLITLGDDLEAAWNHPGASAETRKRILRAVLEEIVVTLADGRIELLLHWRGGDHTRLSVRRNRTGQHRWSTDAEVGDLIRTLARQQADGAIAATLKPARQEDRTWQCIDGGADPELSRTPSSSGPSTRGDGGTRRADR